MVKEKRGEWNKVSKFLSLKYIIKPVKTQVTEWEKILAKHKISECLHHKYIKDSYLPISIQQITQNIGQEYYTGIHKQG